MKTLRELQEDVEIAAQELDDARSEDSRAAIYQAEINYGKARIRLTAAAQQTTAEQKKEL